MADYRERGLDGPISDLLRSRAEEMMETGSMMMRFEVDGHPDCHGFAAPPEPE